MNSMFMILDLQLRTDFHHPCRMILGIIKRNTVPSPMNICVKSCPQSRSKIIGKGQQTRSRRSHLLERPPIMTATNSLGFRGRISQALVSSYLIPTERRPSITVPSATVCFAISQEFLSEIICCISLRTILEIYPTRNPLGTDWEDLCRVRLKL